MRQVTASRPRPRPPHAWLYALPEARLPRFVTCHGQRFAYVKTFKHDFFAATGLYRGPDGLAVLKMGRQNEFLTIPVHWIGALLTRREVRLYVLLQGMPGVPQLIGTVGKHGFLHEFVPGHPLERDEHVSDTFFDELLTLIEGLHVRHIAYVDLNKRENVLAGDDGKPYLIDFQIALYLPPVGWRRLPPIRWLLTRFQQADRYHCLKHKRRLRPDLLTDQQRAEAERLGFWIRLHRGLTRPLTNLRRRALKRLARSETAGVTGSSAK
ncbi:MAG: hypothetical protein ACE5I3_06260 [Phycisphaerae bacterium]